ncbi:MAG: fumarate reductase iron-sulfur subunit [Woeseiaceae bacterium]|nr:fumarate reductase iron-sulfur subunit [Woeseiaceae bacterium]
MTEARRLRFEVFRFNPVEPDAEPRLDTFEIDEQPYMSLYIALNAIREQHDPSLQFDFACRSAICGSCGMLVNGRPALACKTLTSSLPETVRLHPLPVFKLVGDLSVDTGVWFREMVERTEAWIHAENEFDPDALEERMSDDVAQEIYESDRCIECGCCIAACGVANIDDRFLGAAGLNRVTRFALDPRDKRNDSDWFEVVATEKGVFGCIGLMACDDMCPKELPLREHYAWLRRMALRNAG